MIINNIKIFSILIRNHPKVGWLNYKTYFCSVLRFSKSTIKITKRYLYLYYVTAFNYFKISGRGFLSPAAGFMFS